MASKLLFFPEYCAASILLSSLYMQIKVFLIILDTIRKYRLLVPNTEALLCRLILVVWERKTQTKHKMREAEREVPDHAGNLKMEGITRNHQVYLSSLFKSIFLWLPILTLKYTDAILHLRLFCAHHEYQIRVWCILCKIISITRDRIPWLLLLNKKQHRKGYYIINELDGSHKTILKSWSCLQD